MSRFVRLITKSPPQFTCEGDGIFQIAYALHKQMSTYDNRRHQLGSALVWFEKNLPVPPRKKIDPKAMFWFDSKHNDLINKVWEIASLLEEYNVSIRIIKTNKPGYIVYQDKYQVAAIPFRDTLNCK